VERNPDEPLIVLMACSGPHLSRRRRSNRLEVLKTIGFYPFPCWSQSQMKTQRPVAFRPALTDGLALSMCPILAGWGDMSKEKPDRAIPNWIN